MNALRWKILALKASFILVPLVCLILVLHLVLPQARRMHSRSQFSGEVKEWNTEHFRYFSREFSAQEQITTLVEDYYRCFMKEYGGKFMLAEFHEVKPEIHIYGNHVEFEEYHKRHFGPELPNYDAYYHPQYHRIVLYWESERIRGVLYHELTHLILDMGIGQVDTRLSRWLDEGIAGYFERCRIDAGKIEVPALDPNVVDFLKKKGLMHFAHLLQASSREFQGNDNTYYYYQSYFLVYFLLHGDEGRYARKFYQYFQEESQKGPCPAEIFWNIMEEKPPSYPQKSRLYQKCYRLLLSADEITPE